MSGVTARNNDWALKTPAIVAYLPQPGCAEPRAYGDLKATLPLTIVEAKRRLALTFGVKPENIKITVEA